MTKYDKSWSGGFFVDLAKKMVFLHQRDGNTKINPWKWAFFGGLSEDDESPLECFIREIREETGYVAAPDAVRSLRSYPNHELKTTRNVFFVLDVFDENDLQLGEGAGFKWVPFDSLDKIDATDMTRDDINFFLSNFMDDLNNGQ